MKLRAYSMVIALVVIWIFFQIRTGIFLSPVNLANLFKQTCVTGVLAVGMLLVIVARQIDLSVGSLVGLAGGIAAMSQGWGLGASFLSAVVVGLLAGLYPAVYLSSFLPLTALVGRYQRGGMRLREGLVFVQFAISIGVISCSPLEKLMFPMPKNPLVEFSNTRGAISPKASVTIAR